MLDSPCNDIFIHMDAKNKLYNPSEILKLVKFSKIYHVPRIKVSWGGYSQIQAELLLLEAAAGNGCYEHYHLLSGSDLPIKRQNEIADFFEKHHGLEFIEFRSKIFNCQKRIKYYYFLQEFINRHQSILQKFLLYVNKCLLLMQMIFCVSRNRGINFQKGTQWFSITDELARYILTKKEWIRKVFRYTVCCDEIFLHTIVENSDFKHKLFHSEDNSKQSDAVRLIDWERGRPYTFTINELEEIKQSGNLFARKFDELKDAEIIKAIKNLYSITV